MPIRSLGRIAAVALLSLGLFSGASSAATVYDLTGNGGNLGSSGPLNVNGLTEITVSTGTGGGNVDQNGDGLGDRRGANHLTPGE